MLCCDDISDVFVAWRLVVKRRIYLRDSTVRFSGGCGAMGSSVMRVMAVSRYVECHLGGYRDILPAPASSILITVLLWLRDCVVAVHSPSLYSDSKSLIFVLLGVGLSY